MSERTSDKALYEHHHEVCSCKLKVWHKVFGKWEVLSDVTFCMGMVGSQKCTCRHQKQNSEGTAAADLWNWKKLVF